MWETLISFDEMHLDRQQMPDKVPSVVSKSLAIRQDSFQSVSAS